MPAPYPHAYRVQMLRRLVGPDAITATDLSREPNTPSQSILSQWLREARIVGLSDYFKGVPVSESSNPSPRDKFAILLQAAALDDEQLGPFLRENGLRQETLERWKVQLSTSLTARGESPEARTQRLRVKKLEKELARKDKALAEAAALLILQKKARHIWGDEE